MNQLPPALLARLRARPSPVLELLGGEPLSVDAAAGTARMAFLGRPELCNPLGVLQGGMQTAMLDEVMILAAVAHYDADIYLPTLELKTSYLRPAPPGRYEAEGRVLRRGRSIAFMEGRLFDPEGRLVASASTTCSVVPASGAAARPGSGAAP